jgi:hypothetical protein
VEFTLLLQEISAQKSSNIEIFSPKKSSRKQYLACFREFFYDPDFSSKTVCEHGIREKNPQTYLKNKPPFAQKMSKRAKNHHFFMENIKNSTWSTNFILYICIVLLTNKRFFAPKRKIQQV